MAIVEAKYIRSEKFSNKNFFIKIDLYEHGLAKGECKCKRSGVETKMWKNNGYPLLYFPSYHWIFIAEWNEFYRCFTGDKTARRWVRRVMRHSFDGFLTPNGDIDYTLFAIEDDKRHYISREYYRMNTGQLLFVKQYLPELFQGGTFRTGVLPYTNVVLEVSSKEKYNGIPPYVMNDSVRYRKFMQGWYHRHTLKEYIPIERFKEFLKAFDPLFYEQACKERTIDNCNIELEYKFPCGEIPEMRIFVQDNEYDEYLLPDY